jgi:protein-tyrosine phosphatase
MSHSNKRVLNFRGVANLRDLGGYTTTNGRGIKWGLLFRSGELSKLRRADRRRLANLHLHTVVDFRSEEERRRKPDRLPKDPAPKQLHLPILDEANSILVQEVRRRLQERDYAGFDTNGIMQTTYRQLAIDFAPQYRRFFQAIREAGGAPLLWHCTAGKDRAGFGAALLLKLFGVEMETIVEDYMLSARYVDGRPRLLLTARLLRGKQAAALIRSLLTVHESWLRASFRAIDEQYGDFEAYRKQALDISDADLINLRDTYLQ